MPVIVGSTTARTAAAATAASTAFPPSRNTSSPTTDACGWLVAIMPRRPSATDLDPRDARLGAPGRRGVIGRLA